jgi:hypothetical protein
VTYRKLTGHRDHRSESGFSSPAAAPNFFVTVSWSARGPDHHLRALLRLMARIAQSETTADEADSREQD